MLEYKDDNFDACSGDGSCGEEPASSVCPQCGGPGFILWPRCQVAASAAVILPPDSVVVQACTKCEKFVNDMAAACVVFTDAKLFELVGKGTMAAGSKRRKCRGPFRVCFSR